MKHSWFPVVAVLWLSLVFGISFIVLRGGVKAKQFTFKILFQTVQEWPTSTRMENNSSKGNTQ